MSTYRYVSTNILTGQVYHDNLPLVVSSASRILGPSGQGIGALTGYLPLQSNSTLNSLYVNALTPRKTLLWMLQDDFPIWVGVLWDTPHRSIKDNQLPIQAQTLESLFAKRLITGALTYTNTDVLSIARALIAYGVSTLIGPNAQVAQLNLPPTSLLAGVTDTLTFGVSNTLTAAGNTYEGDYSDEQSILDALSTTAAADTFEYTFEPTLTSGGGYGINLRLGYPALGQYNTPTQLLMYPGNALDYARPIMGSNSANYIVGTSAANGSGTTYTSTPPNGVDAADLAAGFPLLQVAITWPGVGVTSQAQINSYVNTQLGQYTAGTMVPWVELGGNQEPLLREIGLGDAITFVATSPLDGRGPGGAPGLQVQARISGWTVTPPAEEVEQAEKIVLGLGALVGQVSTGTVS